MLTEGGRMPLLYADRNEDLVISRIGGSKDVKAHLEDMGLVPGTPIRIINELSGNFIVIVRETRLAISKEMASKIFV